MGKYRPAYRGNGRADTLAHRKRFQRYGLGTPGFVKLSRQRPVKLPPQRGVDDLPRRFRRPWFHITMTYRRSPHRTRLPIFTLARPEMLQMAEEWQEFRHRQRFAYNYVARP